MATYHVKTTGTGSGVGSEADPFTWAQLPSISPVDDDLFLIYEGTHTANVEWEPDVRIYIHGVRSGNRPQIDCTNVPSGDWILNFDSASSTVSFIEFINEINNDGSIINDVSVDCSLFDVKGIRFHVRGGRQGHWVRVEHTGTSSLSGEHLVVSDTNLFNVSTKGVIDSDGQSLTLSNSVLNTCQDIGGPFTIEGCVISHDMQDTTPFSWHLLEVTNSAPTYTSLSNCILLSRESTEPNLVNTTGNTYLGQLHLSNVLYLNVNMNLGLQYDHRENVTEMTADPFVDSANFDFRLTEAAQAESYATRLAKIMLRQLDTPGITMNTEEELISIMNDEEVETPDSPTSTFYNTCYDITYTEVC